MWIPHLPTDGSPIFRQLFAALERAIVEGELAVGARLPPQRALAGRLGVSVGTVTRAYEEADRRGLTVGHVGRGTYVAGSRGFDSVRKPSAVIDLSMNCPPMAAAERLLAESWGKVRRRPDFLDVLNYAPIGGLIHHRRLAASWLTKSAGLDPVAASRVVITAGCQAAMDLVMAHLCAPGDTILVEELTFSGIKALAQHRGYKLAGIPMDREGIDTDALVRVAKACGARVLYTMPTLQNPSGRTLGNARRKELIKAARKLKMTIVEDDNYAVYADASLKISPLANLAPELCYYLSGLSKSLAPGLRTGFAVAPDEASAHALAHGVRASCFAAQSMGMLIAQQAIEDGAAEQTIKENRRIVLARNGFLRKALGAGEESAGSRCSPHVWIRLAEAECERVESKLLQDGIRVTPASVPRLSGARESGLRVCIGAPRREEDFQRAAALIQRAIAEKPVDAAAYV